MNAAPSARVWAHLVERALEEDLGTGDVTSRLVVPASARSTAVLEAREPLVVCGLDVVAVVFERVDASLEWVARRRDGERVEAGAPLATVSGPVRALFAAERTALNFLGRMCGVASFTRRFVDAVADTGVRIVDTRKTLPGWRALDKYAVATGGGVNHRMGLFDGILLKDNHIAIAGGVGPAVKAALADAPVHLRVQVEVESEEQAAAALEAGAHSLLLDNCPPPLLARLVERFGSRATLEASGNVTLANVRDVAATGVHRISIGALTHSAPSADVAMEMVAGGLRA